MKLLALTIESGNGTPIPILAPGGIPTGGGTSFNMILQDILTLVFAIAILMAFGYLIWGGINWIMSQGDKAKIQAARNRILYAIIGLFVMFLSFAIVNFIGMFFGIKLIGASF